MREPTFGVAIILVALAGACAHEGPSSIPIDGPTFDDDDGGGGAPSSGGGGAPLPTTSGAETYATEVHADLFVACGTCHASGAVGAPIFMAESAGAAYAALESYARPLIAPIENSLLVLKGEHTGPALDGPGVPAGLRGRVEAWLTLEAEERGLVVEEQPPMGPTFDEAMNTFAACMQLSDWEAAGMGLLPQQQTQGWGPCVGCHNTGVGGLFLGSDSAVTFEQTKANKYRLQKYVAPSYDADGNFQGLTMADRLIVKGQETCPFQDPADCHPKFVLDPIAQQAIQSFVTQTLSRVDNGTCGP